jgi:hypothetical protein
LGSEKGANASVGMAADLPPAGYRLVSVHLACLTGAENGQLVVSGRERGSSERGRTAGGELRLYREFCERRARG